MDRSLNSLSYTLEMEKSREKKTTKKKVERRHKQHQRAHQRHELRRVVPPNANRDPVLLNHVVLDHRRVRFRGKKNSFFLHKASFVVENPIALQTRSRKKSGTDAFSRSLSLSFACRSSPRSRSTSTPTWSSKNTNSGVWSPTFSSSALWV